MLSKEFGYMFWKYRANFGNFSEKKFYRGWGTINDNETSLGTAQPVNQCNDNSRCLDLLCFKHLIYLLQSQLELSVIQKSLFLFTY